MLLYCRDRVLNVNLPRTYKYTFQHLVSFVCQYWGVETESYMLQTDYSLPVPLKKPCLDWLQHLAVSSKILYGQRPRYIGPRESFQIIDTDQSGQVGLDEFVSLFRRLSNKTKNQAPYVFASIDKDDSGEVTYAEFAQEWDTIYSVLKNDIELDELPVVYLVPRRMFLDKSSIGGESSDVKKTFSLGVAWKSIKHTIKATQFKYVSTIGI